MLAATRPLDACACRYAVHRFAKYSRSMERGWLAFVVGQIIADCCVVDASGSVFGTVLSTTSAGIVW